jgi:hypothetical protein
LVGLREWERASADPKKFQNCDLLEVYTDVEKEKLRNSVKINWSLFNTDKDETDKTKIASDANYIVFSDDKTDEYEKLIATPASRTKDSDGMPGFVDFNEVVDKKVVDKKVDDDDIIDIDDI